MKVSDYIVSFLIEKGITDVFGYPGGMVTDLMDSFDKYKDQIFAHMNYHEQGSAFCACGYGQATHKPGVAYATSGPGATNLITGIANAYFDSIPTIFITGQVNTYEMMAGLKVRQRGFQEMDIISIVKPITKYAIQIKDANDIKYELEKLFYICVHDRIGPVLIDVPMNIFKSQVNPFELKGYEPQQSKDNVIAIEAITYLKDQLSHSQKPVIVAGRGIEIADFRFQFRNLVNKLKVPVVTSMIARDTLPADSPYEFGFIGAYGHRYSNFIVQNSDLIVSIGSRLDNRQTGVNRELFAADAKVIRIDIDAGELAFHLKENEKCFQVDIKDFVAAMLERTDIYFDFTRWIQVCDQLRSELEGMDDQKANIMLREIGNLLAEDALITTDVGQNQVWVAQSIPIKAAQRMFFSGGHGAMGYSLPAAIGVYYGTRKPVISFNGDGGIQMNIQELQFITREQIPIKIFVINNHSLGMIRHFQEMYFNSNFVQTKEGKGYIEPDFEKLAKLYDMPYQKIEEESDIKEIQPLLNNHKPSLIELCLSDNTYVFPKLSMGKPINDQDKLMDRTLFTKLTDICKL